MERTCLLAVLLAIAPLAYADQGSFTNSGGSGSGASGISISNSTVSSPAGTLSMNCPATSSSVCAGGGLTFASTDGTSTINAVFTSGSYSESCSGNGGPIRCYFGLTGYIKGTWTLNGASQAIIGVTYQSFPASGTAGSVQGTTAFNSAYAPFYYSDSEQLLRSDDLMGTNQISYNASALGGLYGAYGLALDSQGRIYIADTYNCRIVRTDDMSGTNGVSYGGTCGSGKGQFSDPSGIAVDSTGKIYIMDTGNSRFVRIDDMTGANWATYGSVGSGVGQFSSFTWVALDSSNRIYIADAGNIRIVRIDDMTGANWTTLTRSPTVNGVSHSFASPAAVAVDSAGKIYIADNEGAPAVVRVDDMTGVNWTSLYVSPTGSTGLNSISVDSGGTVFTGGGGVRFVDGMAGVLTSSGAIGPIGSYYVFGVTPLAVPSPRPSAINFSPSTLSFSQSVGGTSPAQTITVSNFGGSALSISAVSVSGTGFAQTSNCAGTLTVGSTCTVNVTFTPSAANTVTGTLTFADNSGNLGSAQSLTLTGTGVGPFSVSPTSLVFNSQVGTTSAPQTVTATNQGTVSVTISSIAISGAGFTISSNTCGTSLGVGASCSVGVEFSPTAVGTFTGSLTFTDSASGSPQVVNLTGTGSGSTVTLSTSSLNFGNVVLHKTSLPKTVTLTNDQNVSLNFSSIVVSAHFTISSNTCGTSIAAGASCTVGVTFSPTKKGAVTGTLTFNDDAANSPQTVSLAGTAK